MHIRTTSQARALGLLHPRAWRLTAEVPLLAGPGLDEPQARDAYTPQAPIPAGYRKLLADLGHADVVPAGERLRELVATRGWKSHGAVVDAVTAATLRHGAGIGLHRLPADPDGCDLLVTRADGALRITPAFSTRSRPIPVGDLVYGYAREGSDPQPLAWLGRRDCDSADHQLTEDSREALLVVLGCPDEGPDHTEAIGSSVAEILAAAQVRVTLTPVPAIDA